MSEYRNCLVGPNVRRVGLAHIDMDGNQAVMAEGSIGGEDTNQCLRGV